MLNDIVRKVTREIVSKMGKRSDHFVRYEIVENIVWCYVFLLISAALHLLQWVAIIFLSVFILSGCATLDGYATAGIYHDARNDKDTSGQNPVFMLRAGVKSANGCGAEYAHISFVSSGFPAMNDNRETTFDMIGPYCTVDF